jgi:MGT family glycosyltransferase
VYVTLGTFFNRDRSLFTTILDALANEPVTVIATLGPKVDSVSLSPEADNVHVFGYLPQSQVLQRADLVICHGGAGSMIGALSFGLPVLVLPRGADHFYNSDQLVRTGAGRRLLPSQVTAEAVANEVRLLLTNASYRGAAAKVAESVATMPAPCVGVLELARLVGAA